MKQDFRAVVISDLHIHDWSAFATGDGLQNSRLQRSLAVLHHSLALAEDEKIPWLFPGDLVHTAGYALNVVLSGIIEVFQSYPEVVKLVVWGNHDARGVGGTITLDQTVYPALLGGVPNFHVLDSTRPSYMHEGWFIDGGGYQPRGDLLDYGSGADIGLFHQTIRGSRTAQNHELTEGIDPAELLKRFRVSLVGHVHHPQQFDCPKGQAILVPGSPEHHNFGDEGEHGFWILTVPKAKTKNPTVEFIKGGSPMFLTVDGPADVKEDGNFYRIRAVPPGAVVPDNVAVIAPEITTVQQRNLLHGVSEVEAILQVWLQQNRPPEPPDLEHSDDCALGIGGECDCPALNQWDVHDYLTAGRLLLEAQDPVRLRNIRIKRLVLRNFGSYALQEFEYKDGLWLVVGKGKNYVSNGAGKTTLVGEALYWLVTGQNTKGLAAEEIIRWGETECTVEGYFEDWTGYTLNVIRTRRKNKPSLTITEYEGEPWEGASADVLTEKLMRHLGLTSEIYRNLGYFSQEKLLLFASATDAERKNVLADLIGLTAYNDAATAAGQEVSKYETKLEGAKAFVQVRQEGLTEARADLEKAQATSAQWLEAKQQLVRTHEDALGRLIASGAVDLAKERFVALQERSSERMERFRMTVIADLGNVQESIRRELLAGNERLLADVQRRRDQLLADPEFQRFGSAQRIEAFIAALPQVRIELEQAKAKAAEQEQNVLLAAQEYTAAYQGLLSLREQGARVVQERNAAQDTLASGVCPACRQVVTPDHIKTCIEPFERRIDELVEKERNADTWLTRTTEVQQAAKSYQTQVKAEVERLTKYVQVLEGASNLLDRLMGLNRETQSLKQQAAELEERVTTTARERIQSRIALVEARWARRVAAARRAVAEREKKHNRLVEDIQLRLEQARAQVNPHEGHIAVAEDRIRTAYIKIAEFEAQVRAHALKVAIYKYWTKGFSKQGIQSLLMEEVAALFNEHRSNILPVLTQGVFDVQFSTVSWTRAGEAREKTEFIVYKEGELIPYASLSGGERRRVDVGIMLTLVVAVSYWMGVPGILGNLTLDEVTTFLDTSGAEGLMEALIQVQQVIPCVHVIDHGVHLQSLFPQVIRLEQDEEGVSHVLV